MAHDAPAEDAPVVRPRLRGDIPAAAAGLVAVHESDGYPVEGVSEPEAWLTPPGMVNAWVAEIGGTVVGHVAVSRPDGEEAVSRWLDRSGVSTEGGVGVLARLFVVPAARSKGVGEDLVRAAVADARSRGMRLVLDVLTKDTAAIRLYTRLGWTGLGTAVHTFAEGRQAAEALCFVSPPAG
ncbi:GNAT family N-acetyltransferase [Streptomyces sp. NBC_01198]|uniref:GNAT family N-acetyltransferase n=1 Tax=Streptomyces sp. NBC_01198 TaxID=2903769 RepID=UPI002E13DE19|nr:GNAT family N-acetyltransferase [Streptomyces sp. NBC_01198]